MVAHPSRLQSEPELAAYTGIDPVDQGGAHGTPPAPLEVADLFTPN